MEVGKQKKRRKQRKRKHQRRKQKNTTTATAAAAAAVGAPQLPPEIWCSTYKSLLTWHQAQVRSVCGKQMESAETDNCSEREDEEQDEEEEEMYDELEEQDLFGGIDEVEEVDEDYLKFLEITLRHQEELKRTRAAAAAAEA